MSTRSIVGLALVVPAVIVIFFVLTAQGPSKGDLGPRQAEAACTKAAPDCLPEIELVDLNKEVHPFEEMKGKVVVVNFWATWCKPCQREIPAFNRVYEAYKDKGVVFYGIVQEDIAPTDLLNFASDYEMTYPVIPIDENIAREFGLQRSIPTTFIYDKSGTNRRKHPVGPLEDHELRAILDQLLRE